MPPKARHIPLRTCLACGLKQPQRQMVRLVRTLPGSAEIDLKGRKAGRGAYLCVQQECWHKALKKGGLERALRTQISSEIKESLMTQYREQLAAAGKEAT